MNWAIFGRLLGLGAGTAVVTGSTIDLDDLFCGSFTTQADFTDFIATMDDVIADPSGLTAAQILVLDYYEDGVVGYDDRDYWLDQLLKRNMGSQSRLSWADSTPTTKADSDPLGLTTGRSNCLIVDPLNINANGGIGVFVLEAANNTCWLTAARASTPATPANLFNGSGQYNHEVFGDLRSILSGDSGNSTRWRFPKDGAEVTVYIRGGDHELDRESTITKADVTATDNTRIIIRNYPGETVNWYFGNQEQTPTSFDNTVMLTIQRPNTKWRGIILNGYRIRSGTDRVFAPLLLSFANAGTGWEFSDSTMQNFRCIANDHADAGRLPDYVDFAFYYRASVNPGDVTEKALNSTGILVGATSAGVIQDCYFYPARDDFPLNSDDWDHGHCVDLAQTNGCTISRCVFDGPQGHAHIRCLESGSSVCQNITIEDSFFRNQNNSCVIFQASSGGIFRRNRVTGWASFDGAADGTGLASAWLVNGVIQDNVFYQDDRQGYAQNYGIDIAKIQGDNDYVVTGNTITGNVLYRCGMSFGCNSSPPTLAADISRVTSNTVSNNVFYGLSDSSHTTAGGYYDAPITINMGAHTTNMGGNTFTGNQFFRDDGDKAAFAEVLPGPSVTDWTVSDHESWSSGNSWHNPDFADVDEYDFTPSADASAWSILSASIPLHPDDLLFGFNYTCPTGFETAVFDYTLRYKQGRLDLDFPAKAPQLLGKRL